MKKFSKIMSMGLLCIFSFALLVFSGASSEETSSNVTQNAEAIQDALIGAENVCLAIGTYESNVCNTAYLSETELQKTIDIYNEQVDRYYTADNPCNQRYKDLNEYYLYEVFQENCTYRVDGGVLSCETTGLTIDKDGLIAVIDAELVSYNKWIDYTEPNTYEITCCANLQNICARMEKIDGLWKLSEILKCDVTEDWTPEDENNASEYNLATAAETAQTVFTSFDSAKAAAETIDVQSLCPLTAIE